MVKETTIKSYILDKNVFVGTNERELCNFVRSHTIILPETLFYECYTSNELSNRRFLERLYRLLKEGAYVTYQLMQIISDERKNLSPCSCIIDYSETNNLRESHFREERTIGKAEIYEIKKDRSKMAMGIKKLALKIKQKLTGNPDCLKEIRSLKLNRKERFKKWVEMVDKNNIHELANECFCKYVKEPKMFYLSNEWANWHYMRLTYAKVLEYSYLQITGVCPKDENAERDLMDIEYLVLLSKCDALLTCDNNLRDLAEAALSDKKVFSKIQDVDG